MTCLSCHAENASRRRYCHACGVAVGRPCGRCDFRNEITDRYCGGCGQQMLQPAVAATARPVAIALAGGGQEHFPSQAPAPTAIHSDHRPEPRATAAPSPAAKGGDQAQISSQQLAELLRKPVAAAAAAPLSTKVSQAELDELFGGQS